MYVCFRGMVGLTLVLFVVGGIGRQVAVDLAKNGYAGENGRHRSLDPYS